MQRIDVQNERLPNGSIRFSRFSATAAVAAILFFSVFGILRLAERPFDADLLSLLPSQLSEKLPPDLEAAIKEKLTRSSADRAVILLTFREKDDGSYKKEKSAEETSRSALGVSIAGESDALAAADLFEATLIRNNLFTSESAANIRDLKEAAARLAKASGVLLTEKDKARLSSNVNPEVRAKESLACLMSAGNPKWLGFANDPFCLFDHWLASKETAFPATVWFPNEQKKSGNTAAKPRMLVPAKDGKPAALLLTLKVDTDAAASGNGLLSGRIEDAKSNAAEYLRDSNIELQATAAGVPLFTDAIAHAAHSELSFIGTFSAAGVVLFAVFLFGRLSTLAAIILSVTAGFLTALGITLAFFPRLALATFVFAATLIGVAVDYSSHWFATKRPGENLLERRRRMLPSIVMAAGSSAVAYGVLALTPLPGLRQMSLIAATGVLVTAIFVLFVLPLCERAVPQKDTRLMRFLERTLPRIPRLTASNIRNRSVQLALAFVFGVICGGLRNVDLAAGVRDLQGAPQNLVAAQAELGSRLDLASPAQAVFVTGKTLDEALERELSFKIKVSDTPSTVRIASLSDWLPPKRLQDENRALVKKAIESIKPWMTSQLGAAPNLPSDDPLTIEDFRQTPIEPLIDAYLLENEPNRVTLLVMLSGVTPQVLPTLEAAAQSVEGVSLVDLTAGMTATLEVYRDRVLLFLAVGIVVLWGLLGLRFGRDVWRAIVPTLFGIATAFGFLGWAGVPVTLFSALAAVLLLGLGVDYGIFLMGSPNDGRTSAAILFSGVTTMLSFGLLSFSSTPALSAFGLTILVGQVAIWIAAPVLRRP